MKIKILFAFICTFLFTINICAHEYWFEPDTFFPALNGKTAIHLYVGDGLVKDREERVFQLEKTPVFNLFSIWQNARFENFDQRRRDADL